MGGTEFQWDDKPKLLNPQQRLSDVVKLSAHVTRILGQNPGLMTLQGTNSYLLQPPSSPLAPIILIDTSSPHTSTQYVDLVITHLHHLCLESGVREIHFESEAAQKSLAAQPSITPAEVVKGMIREQRSDDTRANEIDLVEYGPHSHWAARPAEPDHKRRFPAVEHIILTHRHLDHVGAVPTLLKELAKLGMPPPKIWKLPSPDEMELTASDRDRPTTDAVLVNSLPHGLYTPFSPFQPIHPLMPGLMISIIDPTYRHLLKHDKDGKPKWKDVPEIARVSVRCLKTPGHTADSVSLVMCEGEKGVFTGDTVLGEGTTIFTDLSAYMTSLRTLLALKPQVLYPAHGPHIPSQPAAAAHIQGYITHRQEREDQILAFLASLSTPHGLAAKLEAYFAKRKAAEEAHIKDMHEFHSGMEYVRPAPAADDADNGVGAKKIQVAPKIGYDMPPHPQTPQARRIKFLENFDPPAPGEGYEGKHTLFKGKGGMVPLSLLTRLVYDTADEKLIFAAMKPVRAHLDKLEKEGKVARGEVRMRKIVDMKVGEEEEVMKGWEAVQNGKEVDVGNDEAGVKGDEQNTRVNGESKDKLKMD